MTLPAPQPYGGRDKWGEVAFDVGLATVGGAWFLVRVLLAVAGRRHDGVGGAVKAIGGWFD